MSWVWNRLLDIIHLKEYSVREPHRIAVLGLEGAGKTTLIRCIRNLNEDDSPGPSQITLGDIVYTLIEVNLEFEDLNTIDVTGFDAVIYVVDLTDTYNLGRNQKEFQVLLNEEDAITPILILGTKCDLLHAMASADICRFLNVNCTGKSDDSLLDITIRPIEMFRCSVVQRTGIGEAFHWLTNQLQN